MREWFSVYKTVRLNRRPNRQWLKLKRWWCTDIEQKNLQNVSQKKFEKTQNQKWERMWQGGVMMVCLRCHQIVKMKCEKAQNQKIWEVKRWNDGGGSALSSNQSCHHWPCPPPPSTQSTPSHNMASPKFGQIWCCKVAEQTIQWDSKFSMTPSEENLGSDLSKSGDSNLSKRSKRDFCLSTFLRSCAFSWSPSRRTIRNWGTVLKSNF